MSFLISGIDEVGRGALAGPLVAVASLFYADPNPRYWEKMHSPVQGVADSKKLAPPRRREIYHRILRHETLLDFGLGEVSVQEIDELGIDRANSLAFKRAVECLHTLPDYILVDGVNPVFGWDMTRQRAFPKGDDLYWPVGAASILAKVIRDTYMAELSRDYPQYRWSQNAGYGTKDHTDALRQHGDCFHHRRAFIRSIRRKAA